MQTRRNPKQSLEMEKDSLEVDTEVDTEGGWPLQHDYDIDAITPDMSGYDIETKGPLKVLINVYIADLPVVDTLAFTFKPKMQVTLDWVDDGALVDESIPNLYADGNTTSTSTANYWTGGFSLRPDLEDKPLESMFNPQLILVNSIADATPSIEKSINIALLRKRPVICEYCEFFPELRSPLNLVEFPFDTSILECRFTSNEWSTKDLQFIWTKEMQDFNKTVSPAARGGPGLSEFEIINVDTAVEGFSYSYMNRYEAQSCEYPHAILKITVRRDPFSYLMRVAIVSVMLMLMECMSFLVDAKDLGGRFSVSGTTFLAMVAFYYCVVDMLPKVAIITRCDYWNLMNFGLMFFSNCENLVCFALMKLKLIEETKLEWIEQRLAVLYVIAVFSALLWFISPLWRRQQGHCMRMSEVTHLGEGEQHKDNDNDKDKNRSKRRGKGNDRRKHKGKGKTE
jgi:hypothetical protein